MGFRNLQEKLENNVPSEIILTHCEIGLLNDAKRGIRDDYYMLCRIPNMVHKMLQTFLKKLFCLAILFRLLSILTYEKAKLKIG